MRRHVRMSRLDIEDAVWWCILRSGCWWCHARQLQDAGRANVDNVRGVGLDFIPMWRCNYLRGYDQLFQMVFGS